MQTIITRKFVLDIKCVSKPCKKSKMDIFGGSEECTWLLFHWPEVASRCTSWRVRCRGDDVAGRPARHFCAQYYYDLLQTWSHTVLQDSWDASHPTLENCGTKCIWFHTTFVTVIFVIGDKRGATITLTVGQIMTWLRREGKKKRKGIDIQSDVDPSNILAMLAATIAIQAHIHVQMHMHTHDDWFVLHGARINWASPLI